jgi:transposase
MRKVKFAACVKSIMPHTRSIPYPAPDLALERGHFLSRIWLTPLRLRHISIYAKFPESLVAKPRPTIPDPKREALAREGVLNPHPESVLDPLFKENPFFDPEDLVQVRYEMVRRHQNDGVPITDVAETFGVSRPTFYKAQTALTDQGLAGLLPQQRGPKEGHKISTEVLSFVNEVKAATPELTVPQLIRLVAERFKLDLHRRTLERALARKKKPRAPP